MSQIQNTTFWNDNYLANCPVRFQSDCFSVSYSFYFTKELKILPRISYVSNGIEYKKELSVIKTQVNQFTYITFGPVNKLNQTENEIVSQLNIEVNIIDKYISPNYFDRLVFKTIYNVPNYAQYTYDSNITQIPLEFKFIVSSCWSLPGYRNPVTTKTYNKLAEICKQENPDQIIISGDIVYMEPISLTSELAVQEAYSQLLNFEPVKNIWASHTIKTGLDDHDLGFNDTFGFNSNINLFRKKAQENFPLELLSDNYRLGSYTVKNITWIFADDISNKKINPKYTGIGNNKFESQLGVKQIEEIKQLLTNVSDAYGLNALAFIVVGKSMFGSINDTFVLCPQERDELFEFIKFLGLRNVIFICGDSHQSDMSEFVLNKSSGQKIREIRNSAIGSKPRNDPTDNPYQVPGSFIGGTNVFGLIKLNQIDFDNYTIGYNVWDANGLVYSTQWRTDY